MLRESRKSTANINYRHETKESWPDVQCPKILNAIPDVFGYCVTGRPAAFGKARPIVKIDQNGAAFLRQDRIASIDLKAER